MFPLSKLFVYVKFSGYVVMYWHSNDLCAKLTFESKACNPHWPCVQWKHLFPAPLPLHSWMALIHCTVLTQHLDPTLTYRQIVEITEQTVAIIHAEYRYSAPLTSILKALDWLASFFLFPENKTAKQINKTSGKFVQFPVKSLNSFPSFHLNNSSPGNIIKAPLSPLGCVQCEAIPWKPTVIQSVRPKPQLF